MYNRKNGKLYDMLSFNSTIFDRYTCITFPLGVNELYFPLTVCRVVQHVLPRDAGPGGRCQAEPDRGTAVHQRQVLANVPLLAGLGPRVCWRDFGDGEQRDAAS